MPRESDGGDGCISQISNVAPYLCGVVYSLCMQGRLPTAQYLHQRLAPLATMLAGEHPAALKYALCLLGQMLPDVRLPLVGLMAPARVEIAKAIAAIEDDLSCNNWESGCGEEWLQGRASTEDGQIAAVAAS